MMCFDHLRGAIEIGPGRMVTRVAFFLWATAYPAWDLLPITKFLQKVVVVVAPHCQRQAELRPHPL